MNLYKYPHTYHKWMEVVELINISIVDFGNKVSSVETLINLLRKIRNVLFESPLNIYKGLGIFLIQLPEAERNHILKNCFKNIFYYVLNHEKNCDSLQPGSCQIPLRSIKSLLACGILCIMPTQTTLDCVASLNFDHCYNSIVLGNKLDWRHLCEVLHLFDTEETGKTRETISFKMLTMYQSELTSQLTARVWPVVLCYRAVPTSERSTSHSQWSQVWPVSSQGHMVQGPALLYPGLLQTPTLVQGLGSNSQLLYSIHPPDPWTRVLSSSMAADIATLTNCLLQLHHPTPSQTRSSGWFKRTRSSSSSSDGGYRRQSSVHCPASSNPRHSYSSSSRSGSLQISSSSAASSRRSSGRDDDLPPCNSSGVAGGYGLQPIIVEETGPTDDEEVLLRATLDSQLSHLMTASISDSSKLSLSRELLNTFNELKPTRVGGPRRNSSPSLTNQLRQFSAVLTSTEMSRCCGEDAKRAAVLLPPMMSQRQPATIATVSSIATLLTFPRRRQSLPCHLSWFSPEATAPRVHQQPPRATSNRLIRLSQFADDLVKNIIRFNGPDGLKHQLLRHRHCRKCMPTNRSLPQDSGEFPEIQFSHYCDNPLHSQDLAKFDKLLYSSTFFDDEAEECFRKFSSMVSPSNSAAAIPRTQVQLPPPLTSTGSIKAVLAPLANAVVVDIIADVLAECRAPGKTVQSPWILHHCPGDEADHCAGLGNACVQLVAAALAQTPDNSPAIVVLEQPPTPAANSGMTQILYTIRALQPELTVSRFHDAVVTFFGRHRNDSFDVYSEFCHFLRQICSETE